MIKLRLDDYSPFIKKSNWEKLFEILESISDKCIIAAIPNHYESMNGINTRLEYKYFTEGLKELNKKGFEIAQHGYSHDYPFLNKKYSLVGSKRETTEFCNVPIHEQERRIFKGLRFFESLGIDIKGFVSPGHSFDKNTIKICERIKFEWFGDSLKYKNDNANCFKKMKLICSNFGLDKFAIKKYNQAIKKELNYQIVIHPNNLTSKELSRLIRLKEIMNK